MSSQSWTVNVTMPEDTEDENDSITQKVIVVGMNRPRLHKIMSMVEDEAKETTSFCTVEFIPCLAAMSSYEGENGESIRYMSTFLHHDGSPMNKFFDDEAFRESLRIVIMVGYEWHTNDEDLVGKLFEANLLSVSIKCVSPNIEFSTLAEEMNHFKNLTDDEKKRHGKNNTMGPNKMKEFILETTSSVVDAGVESRIEGTSATIGDDVEDETNETEEILVAEESLSEEEKKRVPGFIDHTQTTFACKMCRTVLLGENNLAAEHKQAMHSFKRRPHHDRGRGPICQSLFCDDSALEWLAPDGADVEGKLTCFHCNFKLGHWNWSGAQCSCGTWVVPAIQIPLGKVDVILPPSERVKVAPIVIVAPKTM